MSTTAKIDWSKFYAASNLNNNWKIPAASSLNFKDGIFRHLYLSYTDLQQQIQAGTAPDTLFICTDVLVLDSDVTIPQGAFIFARRIEVKAGVQIALNRLTDANLLLLTTQEVVDSATGEPIALKIVAKTPHGDIPWTSKGPLQAVTTIQWEAEDAAPTTYDPDQLDAAYLLEGEPLRIHLRTLFQVATLVASDQPDLSIQMLKWIAALGAASADTRVMRGEALAFISTLRSMASASEGNALLVPQLDPALYADSAQAFSDLLNLRQTKWDLLQNNTADTQNWLAAAKDALAMQQVQDGLNDKLLNNTLETRQQVLAARMIVTRQLVQQRVKLYEKEQLFEAGIKEWLRHEIIKEVFNMLSALFNIISEIPTIIATGPEMGIKSVIQGAKSLTSLGTATMEAILNDAPSMASGTAGAGGGLAAMAGGAVFRLIKPAAQPPDNAPGGDIEMGPVANPVPPVVNPAHSESDDSDETEHTDPSRENDGRPISEGPTSSTEASGLSSSTSSTESEEGDALPPPGSEERENSFFNFPALPESDEESDDESSEESDDDSFVMVGNPADNDLEPDEDNPQNAALTVEQQKAIDKQRAKSDEKLAASFKAIGNDGADVISAITNIVHATKKADAMERAGRQALAATNATLDKSFSSYDLSGLDVITGGEQEWDALERALAHILDRFAKENISGLEEYREALMDFVALGKSYSQCRLAVAKANAQLAEMLLRKQASEQSVAIYQRRVEKLGDHLQIDDTISQLVFNKILDAKRSVYLAMESYRRAFIYFTLSESSAPAVPKLSDSTDTFTEKAKNIAGRALVSSTLSKAPSTMSNIRFSIKEKELLDTFRATGAISFGIDVHHPAFKTLGRVRFNNVRVFVEGLQYADDVEVLMRTSGTYADKMVKPAGQPQRFVGPPLQLNFIYNGANREIKAMANFARRYEDDFFIPTPFTDWTVGVMAHNGTSELDLSTVTALTFEFEGEYTGIVEPNGYFDGQ